MVTVVVTLVIIARL